MLDIGWSELLVIALVALIVVGPKELPVMFKTVGRYMGKARGMAREFQRSMEAAADESGLKEASDSLNSISRYTPKSPTAAAKSYAKSMVAGEDADSKENAVSTPEEDSNAPKSAESTEDAGTKS